MSEQTWRIRKGEGEVNFASVLVGSGGTLPLTAWLVLGLIVVLVWGLKGRK